MKSLKLNHILSFLVLALFMTSCSKENITSNEDQNINLQELALKVVESENYVAVRTIRTNIFDDLASFYMTNKEAIAKDPTVFENYISTYNKYEKELSAHTAKLNSEFPLLSSITEDETIEVLEIAANILPTSEIAHEKDTCWEFCHDQYLLCDQSCYARYLRFPEFTYYGHYIPCNANCVTFVFNTCLDFC